MHLSLIHILLQILPDTEELLILLEEKTDQIQKLTDENQQWQELAWVKYLKHTAAQFQCLRLVPCVDMSHYVYVPRLDTLPYVGCLLYTSRCV